MLLSYICISTGHAEWLCHTRGATEQTRVIYMYSPFNGQYVDVYNFI